MLWTGPFLFTVLFDGYREVDQMSNTLSPTGLLRVLSLGCCCCSVTQLSPALCNPMDCSTPGFPVFHYIPELAQTHVHWVSDAIQPSLSSPSPPAFNLAQHQGLYNQSVLHIRWPKYWSFSFSISPSNEYSGLISLGLTGLISLQSKGLSRVFSNTIVLKHQFFGTQLSLEFNSHIHTWLLEKS